MMAMLHMRVDVAQILTMRKEKYSGGETIMKNRAISQLHHMFDDRLTIWRRNNFLIMIARKGKGIVSMQMSARPVFIFRFGKANNPRTVHGQRKPVMTTRSRHQFALIDAGRGIAALLVVFHHIGNMIAQPRFHGTPIWGGHLGNFNVGVDFFFVLSGFIISWTHWHDLGHSDRLGDYARKRFLRIFPPYWALLFPLMLYYSLRPEAGLPSQHDGTNMLLSIFLLPNSEHPVLGVAWTLTYEIFFYALFALLIVAGRRGLWAMPLWAAAIGAIALVAPMPFPLSMVFSPYNIEFILGVGTAVLLRNAAIPAAGPILLTGVAMFGGAMAFLLHVQDDPLQGRLVFGVASALIILGAVALERRRPVPVPRFLMLLGSASYALYLTHVLVLAFAMPRLWALSGQLTIAFTVILLAALCVMIGLLYHIHVERRLVAVARRLTGSGTGRVPAAPATARAKEV